MEIEYYSFSDMNRTILENLHKLPCNIDIVVGIPRSGMLPANLIALYLNKPFVDLDSFIEGRLFTTGERGSFISKSYASNKVLVMDDSIFQGSALDHAKAKLNSFPHKTDYIFIFGVVYALETSAEKVDFYCKTTSPDRIFQWNLFHHPRFTTQAFFDIDGVLCPDPPIDDDGAVYAEYIANAPVLHKPSVMIDTLVSCRLEKYRNITENWLKKNNIQYKQLILLDFPNKAKRQEWGEHGIYKGEIYAKSNSYLFFESSLQQAKTIFEIAQKPVFCIETFSMFNHKRDFELYDKNIYERICYLEQKNQKQDSVYQDLLLNYNKLMEVSKKDVFQLEKSDATIKLLRKKQVRHLSAIRLLSIISILFMGILLFLIFRL